MNRSANGCQCGLYDFIYPTRFSNVVVHFKRVIM